MKCLICNSLFIHNHNIYTYFGILCSLYYLTYNVQIVFTSQGAQFISYFIAYDEQNRQT